MNTGAFLPYITKMQNLRRLLVYQSYVMAHRSMHDHVNEWSVRPVRYGGSNSNRGASEESAVSASVLMVGSKCHRQVSTSLSYDSDSPLCMQPA